MRIWIFRALAMLLPPLLLVGGGELVLRAAGVGEDLSFVRRDGDRWVDNPRFGRLFFPPQLSRASLPFSVPRERRAGSLRVVVLGGSAAMGIPEPAFGPTHQLRLLLEDAYPGRDVEVINTAITAINSHVVVRIANDILRLEPDLLVLYLGNNEVVGPYGAGTVLAPLSDNVRWIRWGIAWRATRWGQLLTRAAPDAASDLPASWRGMEMFVRNRVHVSDPQLEAVRANYRTNLRDLFAMAADHDLPVVVGTVGVSLRHCGPFASMHAPGLSAADSVQFDRAWGQALAAADSGDWLAALTRAGEAEAIDPTWAGLPFQRARWYDAAGDAVAAAADYARARDLDALRFRHDRWLDAILREEVASAPGRVVLADVAAALAERAAQGIPGRESFLEHVHFSPRGGFVVASTLAEGVGAVVGGTPAPRPWPEQARRMAYSPWEARELYGQLLGMLSRPPFPAQPDHSEQLAWWKAALARADSALARTDPTALVDLHRDAASQGHWLPRFRYGRALYRVGRDPVASATVLRGIVEDLPHFPAARNELAEVLAAQGQLEAALAQLEASLRIEPFQPSARNNLGHCLLGLAAGDPSRRARALEAFARAYAEDPQPRYLANWNLARHQEIDARVGTGDVEGAIAVLRGILASAPEETLAHARLAYLLVDRDPAAARDHARRALAGDPGQALAQDVLRRIGPGPP